MIIRGVDTIDHTLTGAILKPNGFHFVCRYYAGHTSKIGKEITAAEVVEKSKAGIYIVSNWEQTGKPANTVAEGKAHATDWLAQQKEVDGVDWAAVYYSIDESIAPDGMDNYATGWADVIGPHRCGVYGEGNIIRRLKAAGRVRLGWLSMSTAWPGSTNHTGADIIQTGSGKVAGHDVDFGTAMVADYGGWLLGQADPTKPVAPVPAAPPPAATAQPPIVVKPPVVPAPPAPVEAKPTPTPAPAPAHDHEPGSRTLELTDPMMHGYDVGELQRLLNMLPLTERDSIYGPHTRDKVIEAQKAHGIDDDGIVGPITWRALGVKEP